MQHEACDDVLKKSFSVKLIFTQCLKITENVSFNIASEASYVYIMSGQNSVTRQVTFDRTKIGGKCQNGTF